MSKPILDGIRTALKEGKATINLNEASALSGSGSNKGGRVIYDDAFAALRYGNPIRAAGARVVTTIGSDEAFVAKTGNATVIQTGTTNPWGYSVKNNVGNYNTVFWQLPVRVVNAVVPVRTAILDDVNYLDETIAMDMALEFAQQEALSMMLNNDQSGSTTVQTGGTSGLRGLNSYPGSTTAAAFGSNGSAITNGVHTILQVAQGSASVVSYADLAKLQAALPPQYLYKPTTAWMMHPATISALRQQLTTTSNIPYFLEVGDEDGGSVVYIFGHKVIPNGYMDVAGNGKYTVYLAEWERFVTIADREEMMIQRLDQYQPGFINFYAEKRMASTVRDVFAGVRLYF